MQVKELQSRIKGTVTTRTDPAYESLRCGLTWNQLVPHRYPQLVVQAATEQDVVEAVSFARTRRMKVSVRGGGHNWAGFSLRDASLLIDLGRLNQISIDSKAHTATIQPAVTSLELAARLTLHQLAFPVGHCPTVALSGFLLSGGLGWNSNAWGPACFSVEAVRVVIADGSVVVANQEQHADLFWAIRGGGPGFFGVVTQYILKLYPAPRSIGNRTYYYPFQHIEEIGAWVGSIAGQLPKEVELVLVIAAAPPDLADRGRTSNGFLGILSATAFVNTAGEVAAALGPLENCPIIRRCLKKQVSTLTTFDALFDMGHRLWPEHHRYLADTLWSNSQPAKPLRTLREYFLRAVSPKSLALCIFSTGGEGSTFLLPDAAFSVTARTLFLCYAVWNQPEEDFANSEWHRETIAALDSFAVGHYVGESDLVARPMRAERSFAHKNWQHFQTIRQRYDPEDIFHGYFRKTE